MVWGGVAVERQNQGRESRDGSGRDAARARPVRRSISRVAGATPHQTECLPCYPRCLICPLLTYLIRIWDSRFLSQMPAQSITKSRFTIDVIAPLCPELLRYLVAHTKLYFGNDDIDLLPSFPREKLYFNSP